MRFFKDGSLEYGLEPSKKAYDFDSSGLDADYYIAWMHRRTQYLNHFRHVEDDILYRSIDPKRFMREQKINEHTFPDSRNDAIIKVQQPDNHRRTKQTEKGGKPIWINIHLGEQMDIQYHGNYTDKVSSTYHLQESNSNRWGFSETCEMYFSAVRDDNGHPFLRIWLEYCGLDKSDPETEPWGPWEMVAKRISNDGPGEVDKIDLSKNEKLRLGFSMDDRGNFLPVGRIMKDGTSPAYPSDEGTTIEAIYEELLEITERRDALRARGLQIIEKRRRETEDWGTKFSEGVSLTPACSTLARRRGSLVNGDERGYASRQINGNANRDQNGSESDSSLPSGEVSLLSTHEADTQAVPESSERAAKRVRITNGTERP